MSALVYLETFGNQRYIFATNRLRQNVGASQLTHLTGTQWVLDALGRDVAGAGVDNETLRTHLLSPEGNPPLEAENGASAEIVYAVSGKALVLVDTPEQGRELIAAVTQRALIEAPGLEVVGAVGEEFQWNPQEDGRELHRRIGAVAQRQVALRAHLLGPGARAPRLPITASCDSSGQPAVQNAPLGDGWELRSREVASKHRFSHDGGQRLRGLAPAGYSLARLLDELTPPQADEGESDDGAASKGEALADQAGWIGVIHADGNGVGGMFGRFDDHLAGHLGRQPSAREYVTWLRRFSLSLDLVTTRAFQDAMTIPEVAEPDGEVRLLPLILGGDDLTVVCAGRQALPFAVAFLRHFEAHAEDDDLPDVGEVLPAICQQALGVPRMAAAAGVALTKPHFPFFRGHELADELTTSAKQVKRRVVDRGGHPVPCASLDAHVLFDTSDADLTRIREQLTVADGPGPDARAAVLTARPYVVTERRDFDDALDEGSRQWVRPRRWSKLQEALTALAGLQSRSDEDGAGVARTQVQRLRAALFHGPARADAELARAGGRHGDALAPLLPDPPHDGGGTGPASLFWSENRPDDHCREVTRLLDAIELREFAAATPSSPAQGAITADAPEGGGR
jgi:hypothetical protein